MKVSADPLLLDQRSVDALYDCLSDVAEALDDLKIPFVLVAGSLLGAVRSRSLLFCDDDIDVAVFEEDYARLKELLPARLGKKNTFVLRPWPAADRVRPRACPQVWIDVFMLRRFDNLNQLRAAVSFKDNGQPQSEEYIWSCLQHASVAHFPVWHYDARKAIELWPGEFLTESELFPVRFDLSFGPLSRVPCPALPVPYLRRSYGGSCFEHYCVAAGHMQWSKEVRTRWARLQEITAVPVSPPGTLLLMEEQHFAPVPHSKRPNGATHSRQELIRFVQAEDNARNTAKPNHFGACIAAFTKGAPEIEFSAELRKVMEPHIAKARSKRDATIASGVSAVVYSVLKREESRDEAVVAFGEMAREFKLSFDVLRHPLREALAEALSLPPRAAAFERFHEEGPGAQGVPKREALAGLLDAGKRMIFHRVYDNFVREAVLPSMSLPGGIVRYQSFPCVRIIRPGEFSIGPHSDTSYGFNSGQINFVVPLTPFCGASSLFIESWPGLADWHSVAGGYGVMTRFFGMLCLHFTSENTTSQTRASLDFRVVPEEMWDGGHDQYTRQDGYYVRARLVDGAWLRDGDIPTPDKRHGCPF